MSPRINKLDGHIDINMYVHAMWKRQGKDYSKCELCSKDLAEGQGSIHHTKYDGATLKDLRWVCQKCNTQPENKNLD